MDQGEQSAAAQRRPRMVQYGEPQPPRRCPRCESGNTKFCYFNNYNASQPRYFCKACRRYWTHGGTLRNVPHGGGGTLRRRKRPKKTSTPESPAGGVAHPPIEDKVEVEPSITASEAVLMPSLFIRGLGAWQDGSFDPQMLFGAINYNVPALPPAPMQVMGMNPGMMGPPRAPQMNAGVFRQAAAAAPPPASGGAEDDGEGFWRDFVGGGWAPDLPGGRGSRPPTPPPFI